MKKLFGLCFSDLKYKNLTEKYNKMVEIINTMCKEQDMAIDYSRGGEVKDGCGWFFMNYTNNLGELKKIIDGEV